MFNNVRVGLSNLLIILVLIIAIIFLYLFQRQAIYETVKNNNAEFSQQEKIHYEQQAAEWTAILETLTKSWELRVYLKALNEKEQSDVQKKSLERLFNDLSFHQLNDVDVIRFIDKSGAETIVSENGKTVTEYSQIDSAELFRTGVVTPVGDLTRVKYEIINDEVYLHRGTPVALKNKRLGMVVISINMTKLIVRYKYLLSMSVMDGVVFLSHQGKVLHSMGTDDSVNAEAMQVYRTMTQSSESHSLVEYEGNVWSFVKEKNYGINILFLSKGERLIGGLDSEYKKLVLVLLLSGFLLLYYLFKAGRIDRRSRVKTKESSTIIEQRAHNFASISDEIRHPINTLLGALNTLSETKMEASQEKYTATARKSASCLLELVNQIQDYSKISRGEFELEKIKFDLRSTLFDIVELMSPEADDKGLEISCLVSAGVPMRVSGDATRLRQIMLNLLGYAVRNTQGGEILLSISAENHSANLKYINIDISDTGSSVEQETLLQQIMLFSAVDFNVENNGSAEGLGLALSKHLIDLMSGEMSSFENNVGGNTFRIRLPFAVVELFIANKERQVDIKEKRILIVGEIEHSRNALAKHFSQWGMHCVELDEFERGVNVLRASYLAKKEIDICFIDVSYSSSSKKAFELAENIRQEFSIDELALITLTAQGSPGDARHAKEMDIQAYLTKPLDLCVLRSTIDQVLDVDTEHKPVLLTKHNLKEEKGLHACRVLLIEYDAEKKKQLVKRIMNLGASVDLAENTQQIEAAVESTKYNVIFINTSLPGLDVFSFIQTLRRGGNELNAFPNHLDENVAIIALSNNPDGKLADKCRQHGMNDVLFFPLDDEKLRSFISAP